MTRLIAATLLVLSLATNFYLFMKLVDAGIMLDNAWDQVKYLRQRNQESLAIVRMDWVGRDEQALSDLAQLAKSQGLQIDTFEVGVVEIGGIRFEVNDGVVVRIKHLD